VGSAPASRRRVTLARLESDADVKGSPRLPGALQNLRVTDSLSGLAPLIPILALAAIVRFASLSQRGLLYWDEGKFALEGIRLLSVLHTFPNVAAASLAGKAVGTAKPTHALLIALSYEAMGVHDYAPLMLEASASVVQVALVFLLARRIFGRKVALIAAALLAVSSYDVIYARSGLSESDAELFFLAAVYVWWQNTSRLEPELEERWTPSLRRLASGTLAGLAFTTNYRLSVYVATLIAFDLITVARRAGFRGTTLCACAWLVGLAILPVIWQIAGVLASAHGVILFRSEIDGHPVTYFSQVAYQLHGGKQAALRFSPLPYLQWYVVRQGWAVSALFLVGIVAGARTKSYSWLVPIILVVGPCAVHQFAPFIVPRNIDAVLPFASILAAAGLLFIVERFRTRSLAPIAPGFTALLICVPAALQSWQLSSDRSGFALAARYVAKHESSGALVVNEVMLFYLRDPGRGCDAPRLPDKSASLVPGGGTGGDLAVVDQYYLPAARHLARHARLVAKFPTVNSSIRSEDLIASENGMSPLIRRPEYVDVYSLESLHPRVHGVAAPQPCSLDRLA
jgi:4-amino-4-deoxy-L-arabinose transferase-like glycosyltransferase